jgi:hypothetical protein
MGKASRKKWEARIRAVLSTRKSESKKSIWYLLFSWPVVAALVSLLVTLGLGVMSMTPPEYKIGEASFIAAAVILFSRVGWWLWFESEGENPVKLIILAFVLFGAIAVLCIGSIKWVESRKPKSQLTVDEINAKIGEWLRGYNARSENDSNYFIYKVVSPVEGNEINVSLSRRGEIKIIWFTSIEGLRGDVLRQFQGLTERQKDIVASSLGAEMIRFNVAFTNLRPPLDDVTLTSSLQYDENVTDKTFRKALSDYNRAISLYREVLVREMNIVRKE